ncbi:hypothetical protein [Corynebacterium coyleae]|uniref:hypothetical protein n=1 Tax=Corynebacterium coyleae TaxID=53374 RepID=UPI00254E6F56|nr:hypothetical protein [Corynebacterium coyleae]MDK8242869.1 hypothetical protein [Corynebacterium coyleae]
MGLRKLPTVRDSVLMRCTGKTPSARNWATWEPATPHPALTISGTGEMLETVSGRWRVEVLEGRVLTYLDGANMGNLTQGTYAYEGQLRIYNMAAGAPLVLILTRLH